MANLSTKIYLYCKENSKTVNFTKGDVVIQNDGSGAKIIEWNIDGLSQPTDDQLNALSSQATTLENNNQAVFNRQKEYGTVAKQIEFITEKGLEAWKTNVQAIKTKYPKE